MAIIELNENECKDLRLAKGNTKLGKGIWTVNLLPGDDPVYIDSKQQTLINIEGTCKGVCEGCKNRCYAMRDLKLHYNVTAKAWGINTIIMRRSLEEFFNLLKEALIKNKVKILRYQSAGEIESYEYLVKMKELAEQLPNVHFYFYTKRFDFMIRFLKDYPNGLPNNLVGNLSEWGNNLARMKEEFKNVNKFVWDDGDDPEIAKLPHCPSVIKNKPTDKKGRLREGVHCDTCGLCWRKNTGRRIAVFNH